MESIRLTSKQNEEIIVNLINVVAFDGNEEGTTVKFKNNITVEVQESIEIVEYLLNHYVFDVTLDGTVEEPFYREN